MSAFTENWWRSKGFGEMPRYYEADGTERIFRVYGGETSKLYGSCYSFSNPRTVSNAEFDANIVKWGNTCLWIAEFSAKKGTPFYVGRIDQSYERKDIDDGEDVFLGGNWKAEQIWIDPVRAPAYLTHVKSTKLIQDKVVMTRTGNA